MPDGSIFTFYSYKGGVGRSLALANVGALLCKWGYRVLCVDWDLEAPGLHLYFEKWLTPGPLAPGLTELVQAFANGENPDWRQYVTSVQFPGTIHGLALIGAGIQDAGYVSRLQALSWEHLYQDRERNFGQFLEDLRTEWKQQYDFILIDSRTGITDSGGICTIAVPDYLVVMFTANYQSLRGCIDVVRRASEARNRLPYDREKLLALPIASRFESFVEYQLSQKWLKTFADELRPIFATWANKEISAEDLLNHTVIPYIAYWSYGERIPVIEKGTSDPKDIGYSFETIAALIGNRLSHTDVLIKNRDSYVSAANREPPPPAAADSGKKPLHIFLFAMSDVKQMHDSLSRHLQPLVRLGMLDSPKGSDVALGHSLPQDVSLDLERAEVIIFLISPQFMASDWVQQVLVTRALEKAAGREALVIPILARPALWQYSRLAELQVLPIDGQPVSQRTDRDQAWVEVVQTIMDRLSAWRVVRAL